MTRDDHYTPFTGRHQEPDMPVLVEMLWRVVGPTGKPSVCGVYRVAAGFDVRSYWPSLADRDLPCHKTPVHFGVSS